MSDIKLCDICGDRIDDLMDFYLKFNVHYSFDIARNDCRIPEGGDICAKCCARIFRKEETENDRLEQRDTGSD